MLGAWQILFLDFLTTELFIIGTLTSGLTIGLSVITGFWICFGSGFDMVFGVVVGGTIGVIIAGVTVVTVGFLTSEIVNPLRIIGKDTISYFGILLDNKVTQWIARLRFTQNKKLIIIPIKNKQEIKFEISNIYEIYNYKEQIKEGVSNYLK